ncbi:MAG: hypothetical protein K6F55_01035 [Eubacterium sp.]|nr:hypothetical protein [Eubacterium sp.]
MKKLSKKVFSLLLALAIAFSLNVPASKVEAATHKDKVYITNSYQSLYDEDSDSWKNDKIGYCGLDDHNKFYVYMVKETDTITNIKVNKKKALDVSIESKSTTGKWDDKTNTYKSIPYWEIRYRAKKAGKFVISFKVNGKKYKYTVIAQAYKNPYKLVTYGKQVVYKQNVTYKKGVATTKTITNTKVSADSGNLKVVASPGYKITGIIVVTTGTNGKPVIKKVKNGKNINLSQYYTENEHYSEGVVYNHSLQKNTSIYISYKNIYDKSSVTYSIFKKHGAKELKCVQKFADGSRKKTSYFVPRYSGGDLTLWKY